MADAHSGCGDIGFKFELQTFDLSRQMEDTCDNLFLGGVTS